MREVIIEGEYKDPIQGFVWDNVTEIKGIVQLVHGAAERCSRYEEFAKRLNQQGIIVVGNDHRGHGLTSKLQNKTPGLFYEQDGWMVATRDLNHVTNFIKHNWKDKPIIMFGHSMGSFLARTYASIYGKNLSGLVICGTSEYNRFILTIAIRICKSRVKKGGLYKPDIFVWKQSFKKLNKKFAYKGCNGEEWKTTDKIEQQKFIDDELVGHKFTSQGYLDLFTGLKYIATKKNYKAIPKDLPIYIISGKDDSVGNFGKKVKKVYKRLIKNHTNVKMDLIEKGRHEFFNDIQKEEGYAKIIGFINQVVSFSK